MDQMTFSLFFQSLINGLNQGAIYALIALGYTMVYGIIRMINFAHGDFIMIGAYTLFYTIPLMVNAGMPAWLSVIVAIAVCALVGVLVETFAYRPVRKAGPMSALITALAMSIFLENLAMVLFGAKPHNVQAIFSLPTITVGTVALPLNVLLTIAIGLGIMIALQLFVKKTKLGKAMRALLKNKPFIALCIVSMLLICFQMYTQTVYNYLFKNFYEKPGLYALVTVCTYLPMVLLLPFMGKLIRKYGKKEICSAGILFALIVNIAMFVIKFTPAVSNPYVFLVLSFFSGAGQTFLIMQIWALVTDVTDYHEYISGRREEGTSYSFYSFVRKLGQTVAGAGAAGVLGVIGYDGKLAVQSPEVLTRLYDIATIVPAILLALIFVVLTFGYKLSKEQLDELHNVLRERREKAEAESK